MHKNAREVCLEEPATALRSQPAWPGRLVC